MKPKVGQYYYTFHGKGYRIFQYIEVTDRGSSAAPVHEEPTYFNREAARKRVYELNGWRYEKK